MPTLSYALVTPARNERDNLARLAGSVAAQTSRPVAWVIVDDASDDGTAELAAGLAAEHAWIHVVGTSRMSDALAAGRRRGRALDSFRDGVRALPVDADIVVKVDADTSFDPGYFPGLVARFEADPSLGIAGGACYELEDGVWTRQKVLATHPRGASRAYRAACVPDVMALESRMGWDGLDEVKARLRGYRSATISELGFFHHRATGAREHDRVRHQKAQGEAAWYMGYRPSYLFARSLYRMLRDPAAVGMIWGYAAAARNRVERCPEPAVIRALRDEQRMRSLIRRGAPT